MCWEESNKVESSPPILLVSPSPFGWVIYISSIKRLMNLNGKQINLRWNRVTRAVLILSSFCFDWPCFFGCLRIIQLFMFMCLLNINISGFS